MDLTLTFEDNGTAHNDLVLRIGECIWRCDSYYLGLDQRVLADDEDASKVQIVLRALLEKWRNAAVAQMFSPGTVMSKHTHQYDSEGRLIESTLTMMGMEVGRQTFAYDEAGNKSEEISHNVGGTMGKTIFTRDYDEHGNWTTELLSTVSNWDAEFGLSTPAQVTHRTITYFT